MSAAQWTSGPLLHRRREVRSVVRHQQPLADSLDLAALQELRPTVYALLHALDFTLDEAIPIIGLLVEIDRRIALIERLQRSTARALARF